MWLAAVFRGWDLQSDEVEGVPKLLPRMEMSCANGNVAKGKPQHTKSHQTRGEIQIDCSRVNGTSLLKNRGNLHAHRQLNSPELPF